MTLVRKKWFVVVLVFLFATSAAWSKFFDAHIGIASATGPLTPDWLRSMLTYSALLVPLDTLLTLVLIYYFGKGLKGQAKPD